VPLLVLRMEGDGAVEQRDDRLEAAFVEHRAGLERGAERLRQEAEPLQVAPVDSRRQPSSRVMRSVCAPVIAGVWPDNISSTRSASTEE
jgi:hypothetical protein